MNTVTKFYTKLKISRQELCQQVQSNFGPKTGWKMYSPSIMDDKW